MTDVNNSTSRFEIVYVDRVYWHTKCACYGLKQGSVMLSVWHMAVIVRRPLLPCVIHRASIVRRPLWASHTWR